MLCGNRGLQETAPLVEKNQTKSKVYGNQGPKEPQVNI